ncbi:ABC transporter permease [Cellulomonas sp. Leaf334]|uniref:ABC transporter permease n=1 Tax=Cellulomonas sp. Leaf334 TaxID=1736339 RepID=UPI0006FF1816|nr:ABC transporter permease subunit [Cellulomonas sp. Leaf334]KQR08495.1 hypothetical protein ASF78_19755 [Cellulomonas sp. Leaf334]
MTLSEVELEHEPSTKPPRAARGATWGLTWHGVRTVAVLELRQRVRSTRWVVALVVWFVVVGGITLLTSGAISTSASGESGPGPSAGPLLFGAVTFLVLGLGLLVTPTLASTGINGDRNAGTLATLQVTLLTPAEIAAGKLLAAWAVACAFLVASLPFLGIALAMEGTPGTALLRVVLLVAVLLACVCGIGLGFSALTTRTAGSTVLTFLTVAALTLLTPILFGLTFPTISRTQEVPVSSGPMSFDDESGTAACEVTVQERSVAHTERTWWLLGINPFVVLADGAGTTEHARFADNSNDPLGMIRDGVRQLRAGPAIPVDECWLDSSVEDRQDTVSRAPVWPWGLAVDVLLGAAGYVVAVRRLRIPQRTLPRGTRVA